MQLRPRRLKLNRAVRIWKARYAVAPAPTSLPNHGRLCGRGNKSEAGPFGTYSSGMNSLRHQFDAQRSAHPVDGIEARLCIGAQCLVQCLAGDS